MGQLSSKFFLSSVVESLKLAADGMVAGSCLFIARENYDPSSIAIRERAGSEAKLDGPEWKRAEQELKVDGRGALYASIGLGLSYFGLRGLRGLAEVISPGCTLRPFIAIWHAIKR